MTSDMTDATADTRSADVPADGAIAQDGAPTPTSPPTPPAIRFDVMTLFPSLVEGPLSESMTGRALDAGVWSLRMHQIRDYADNDYGRVDDTLYGGGTGMLMQCEPIYRCYEAVMADPTPAPVLMPSPKGEVFNQRMAEALAAYPRLIFLCGHYEGIDERVMEALDVREISLGDFVLTGGEPATVCMIDAILRMVPDVLPEPDAYREESHYAGLLEERQYTKPKVWRGREVPEVLLSGHHAKIERARRRDRLRETYRKRPDLLDRAELSREDRVMLAKIVADEEGAALGDR